MFVFQLPSRYPSLLLCSSTQRILFYQCILFELSPRIRGPPFRSGSLQSRSLLDDRRVRELLKKSGASLSAWLPLLLSK